MNNADSKAKSDAETEPRKIDVLRAKDIIQSLKKPEDPAPVSQQAGQDAPTRPTELQKQPEQELGTENLPSTKEEQKKPAEDISAEATTTEQPKSEIPRFNLAEKIMAEQRRITAVRRKGPSQEEDQEQELEAKPVSNTEERVPPALSEEEQIIADIVSRDIEKLCRGCVSSVKG